MYAPGDLVSLKDRGEPAVMTKVPGPLGTENPETGELRDEDVALVLAVCAREFCGEPRNEVLVLNNRNELGWAITALIELANRCR